MPSSNAFLSMTRHAWTNTQSDNAFYLLKFFFPLSSMSSVCLSYAAIDRWYVWTVSNGCMHGGRWTSKTKKKNEMIQISGV
jgi:hypothetical protein